MLWYFSFDGWILPADASVLMSACVVLSYLFFGYVFYQLKREKKRAKGNRTRVRRYNMQIKVMDDVHCPILTFALFMVQYLVSSFFYFESPNVLQYYLQIAILGSNPRGN